MTKNEDFINFITFMTVIVSTIFVLTALILVLVPLAYHLFDLWVQYLGFAGVDRSKVTWWF